MCRVWDMEYQVSRTALDTPYPSYDAGCRFWHDCTL
jgi:hypothetical protein